MLFDKSLAQKSPAAHDVGLDPAGPLTAVQGKGDAEKGGLSLDLPASNREVDEHG